MDRCRRILFILPTLDGGGAEKVILSLAGAFLHSGAWRPALLLTTRGAGARDTHVPAGLDVIRIDATHLRRALPRLVRLIRQIRPAVVFAALDHLNAALGLIAPLLPRGTRLVLRATSLRVLTQPFQARLLARAFRRADLVIFQSDAMRQALMTGLRLPEHLPAAVMPNPLDFGDIAARAGAYRPVWPTATPLRLIAAGRLTPAKGFDLLISAMADLPQTVSLVILGEGEAQSALNHQITASGLSGRVVLAGFQDNPYAWFAGADAYVLSSRVEGFPNVVIEAIACGCPVLATPLPGLADIAGCRLAAAVSAPALTDLILDFITTPHRAEPATLHARHDLHALRHDYERLFATHFTERPAHARDLHP